MPSVRLLARVATALPISDAEYAVYRCSWSWSRVRVRVRVRIFVRRRKRREEGE